MLGKMENFRCLSSDDSRAHGHDSQPMGKLVQPLQSVNCHDSRAHGHEQHGPFTRLVGFG
jgi:hypothetical protein